MVLHGPTNTISWVGNRTVIQSSIGWAKALWMRDTRPYACPVFSVRDPCLSLDLTKYSWDEFLDPVAARFRLPLYAPPHFSAPVGCSGARTLAALFSAPIEQCTTMPFVTLIGSGSITEANSDRVVLMPIGGTNQSNRPFHSITPNSDAACGATG